MAAFSRVQYNFNSRFILNDTTTDTTAYALVGRFLAESTTLNVETDRPVDIGSINFSSKISGGAIEIPIILFATTMGKMNDLIDDIKEAFNPDLVKNDSTYGEGVLAFPGGDGFMPLRWTEEIDSGTRAVRVFAKPLEVPSIDMETTKGRARAGRLLMRIEDPRKYLQAQSSISNSATATNSGNFRVPVQITISATGTTSTSLTITNSTRSEVIVVSTALSAGQTLVIDTRHQSVKLNGTEKRSMISTTSEWIQLDPGDNTI